LLGFLDNFNWEFDAATEPSYNGHVSAPKVLPPYSNPHLNMSPEPSTSSRARLNKATSMRGTHTIAEEPQHYIDAKDAQQTMAPTSPPSTTPSPPTHFAVDLKNPDISARTHTKPLLSTPQKRLNHIMSEQKRRNAIRDGYASLIALLAPAGSPPGLGMPTRGRPKGSGSRGKGRSKGKSGVLFRAVEYTRWLEEGRDALKEEVLKVEAAAGIVHHP
jgi:hypothetical protein